jgi:hypothetical protein
MKRLTLVMVFGFSLVLLASGLAAAADDSKVKGAAEQVKSGAVDTAKGIGGTVSEGAKYTGEKLKEAGQAAEPPAKTAWGNARDGAVGFGQTVKGFFTNLFSR